MRPLKLFKRMMFWMGIWAALWSTQAKAAGFSEISITNTPEHLLLYLKIDGAFSEPIQEAVFSGAPITFSFQIRLEGRRTFWADESLANITLTHTIKFNPLKKEFTITRSWEPETPILVKTFQEAQDFMCMVDGLPIIPVRQLEKDRRYVVRAKAELTEMKLPFYVRYINMMASRWQFETDWGELEFAY